MTAFTPKGHLQHRTFGLQNQKYYQALYQVCRPSSALGTRKKWYLSHCMLQWLLFSGAWRSQSERTSGLRHLWSWGGLKKIYKDKTFHFVKTKFLMLAMVDILPTSKWLTWLPSYYTLPLKYPAKVLCVQRWDGAFGRWLDCRGTTEYTPLMSIVPHWWVPMLLWGEDWLNGWVAGGMTYEGPLLLSPPPGCHEVSGFLPSCLSTMLLLP